MGKRHRNLFPLITSGENLRAAYALTSRGRRQTTGYLLFREEAEAQLALLGEELSSGRYEPGPYREFTVREPKVRRIAALSFRDRVVQHALCRVIEPVFERILMGRCYACRQGKGVHYGVRAVQAELRRLQAVAGEVFFLKTDFRAYFASIDRVILWREIERKIHCLRTLELIERFTPRTGIGVPVGNLTSQLWGNVYGHIFDRWMMGQGALRWHRYMDDVVVLDTAWGPLAELQKRAASFAAEHMHLSFSRWMVARCDRGINFLGYRIWPTHKLLRKSSVAAARRKLHHFTRAGDECGRTRFLAAWLGHARHADSYHLLQSLNLQIS